MKTSAKTPNTSPTRLRNYYFTLVFICQTAILDTMTPAGKMLTWLCLIFALCAKAAAIPSDNSTTSAAKDYEQISIRNIFGLKPPPPPAPPETVKTPPSKIVLTGITTFGGKRAIMKASGTPKVGQAAPEQTLVLRENQKEGEIEVIGIDESSGTVKVMNGGVEQLLSFDKDGMKPSTAGTAAPAPGAAPGIPHPAPLPAPVPAAVGGFKPAQPFPPRPPRSDNSAVNPAATAAPAFGAAAPAYTANAQPQEQQQPQMSYEQQLIMMELNREATKDKVLKGELPPIPFTELTPSDAVGARQNPAAANPNPATTRGFPRGQFPQ